MPCVEGESLRDKLANEGERPIAEALRILREVADALTDAHCQGVVRRDISTTRTRFLDITLDEYTGVLHTTLRFPHDTTQQFAQYMRAKVMD